MGIVFCSPRSREPLEVGPGGHLFNPQGILEFENHNGSYDFVVDAHSREEREYYDQTYADGGWWGAADECSTEDIDYTSLWRLEPSSQAYLRSLGNLAGKIVLLIGNGTSVKEFFFVALGAHVVFTDLSFAGVLHAKRRYQSSGLGAEKPNSCEFHAVNAYFLPFRESTFDIVCADAMIHHLEDLRTLFGEIHRCLKPGGVCRFSDTAYSSAWQGAKKTILRPMQKYVHKNQGISPEDKRATERGGYTREELEQLKSEIGFRSVYYQRVALLDYLLWRARCKLNLPSVLAFRPAIRWVDGLLARTPIMEKQGISLVLGFDK